MNAAANLFSSIATSDRHAFPLFLLLFLLLLLHFLFHHEDCCIYRSLKMLMLSYYISLYHRVVTSTAIRLHFHLVSLSIALVAMEAMEDEERMSSSPLLLDMRCACCVQASEIYVESTQDNVICARFTLFTPHERENDKDEDENDDKSEDELVDAMIASHRAMGAALPQRCARDIVLLLPYCELGEDCPCSRCTTCYSSSSGDDNCAGQRRQEMRRRRRMVNAATRRFLGPWKVIAEYACVMQLLDFAKRCREEENTDQYERRGADSLHAYCSALRRRREGEGATTAGPSNKACFPRLFEPCAAATHCITAMMESARIDNPSLDGDRVLKLIAVDLACGSGRDIVFVAETMRDIEEKEMTTNSDTSRGRRKWVFAGADHCARHGNALAALASQRGLSVHDVEFIATGNLRKDGVVEEILDALEERLGGKVAMVMMSRFFDRGLLARVATRLHNAAMSLGITVLALSQFEGLDLCIAHGHPRRERDVLREKEMDELVRTWNTNLLSREEDAVDHLDSGSCARQTGSGGDVVVWSTVYNKLRHVSDSSGRMTREFVAVASSPSTYPHNSCPPFHVPVASIVE